MLTADDQAALFTLARESIRAHLLGEPPPELPRGSDDLSAIRGVFVTLRQAGQLRGCIGHTVGRLPLAEGIRTLAVSAAFGDRRFSPVTMADLGALEIEFSVLSPLEAADPDAIQIGVHGLVVRRGAKAGLLLPQVASDRGWDVPTFLEATCTKAELPPDAWRDPDAELEWFRCDIYGEPTSA